MQNSVFTFEDTWIWKMPKLYSHLDLKSSTQPETPKQIHLILTLKQKIHKLVHSNFSKEICRLSRTKNWDITASYVTNSGQSGPSRELQERDVLQITLGFQIRHSVMIRLVARCRRKIGLLSTGLTSFCIGTLRIVFSCVFFLFAWRNCFDTIDFLVALKGSVFVFKNLSLSINLNYQYFYYNHPYLFTLLKIYYQ